MNTEIAIADLIHVNKLLYNFMNQLIDENAILYSPILKMLAIRGNDLNNNKNVLIRLLEGDDLRNEFAGNALLNEWQKNDTVQYSLEDDETEMLEFEYRVVAALEAYKTALNATSLTCFVKRSVLMDQKYFLQGFMVELIKYRELNSRLHVSALFV